MLTPSSYRRQERMRRRILVGCILQLVLSLVPAFVGICVSAVFVLPRGDYLTAAIVSGLGVCASVCLLLAYHYSDQPKPYHSWDAIRSRAAFEYARALEAEMYRERELLDRRRANL